MRYPLKTNFMPTASLPPDSLKALNDVRQLYQKVAHRSAKAWALINRAAGLRLWVPANLALDRIADSIYYNASYTASEEYSCIDSFKFDLKDEVEEAFGEVELINGVAHYVLRPFFNPESSPFLSKLGLAYLCGCRLSELAPLNVAEPSDPPCSPLCGLSADELDILVKAYTSQALTLINTLRHLSTALCYVSKRLGEGMRLGIAGPELPHDSAAYAVVAELVQVCTLPIEPAPAKYFGTEASKVNPLQALPVPASTLAALML